MKLVLPRELNAYDILVSDWVVFSKATLEAAVAHYGRRHPSPDADAESGADAEVTAKSARDILIRPVVSEKSYAAFDANVYTFLVAHDANKIEIKNAVESIFGVRVTNVNTLNRKGKRKKNRRTGNWGSRAASKRAIVSLAAGDRIEIFGS